MRALPFLSEHRTVQHRLYKVFNDVGMLVNYKLYIELTAQVIKQSSIPFSCDDLPWPPVGFDKAYNIAQKQIDLIVVDRNIVEADDKPGICLLYTSRCV